MFIKSAILSIGAAFALAAAMSPAKAQYAVWYDYNDLDVPHGSMLINGKKLLPPNYACGMRFYDPDRLNWVDYSYSKKGFDLDGAVDVWLPLPNCPKNDIVIERSTDDQVFTVPNNFDVKFAEIETSPAGRWFNKNGDVPKAPGIPNLPLKANVAKWAGMALALAALKDQIVDTGTQQRAYVAAQQSQSDVVELASDLAGKIAQRRRSDLPDREASVRDLEDAATTKLSFAATKLATAVRQARSAMYSDAFLSTDLARTAIIDASMLIDAAQAAIEPVE